MIATWSYLFTRPKTNSAAPEKHASARPQDGQTVADPQIVQTVAEPSDQEWEENICVAYIAPAKSQSKSHQKTDIKIRTMTSREIALMENFRIRGRFTNLEQQEMRRIRNSRKPVWERRESFEV